MKDYHENKLALFLKELRLREHYTQAFVAEKLGISRQGYNHYERGNSSPDLKSLSLLAKLYNIPLEAFLDVQKRGISYLKENSTAGSLYQELLHSLHYSEDFLQYFKDAEHQKKYHWLNRPEKEMLFYFQQLKEEEQLDILFHAYLKYIQKQY